MIYYVSSSDYLAELPAFFNPADTASIVLRQEEYDESTVEINCAYTQQDKFFYIDLHQFTSDFEIVIHCGEQTCKTNVVLDTFNYTKLEYWLKLQQLDYLIPVLKKFGWYKVKEAANLAAKFTRMQGTEYVITQMLRLFNVYGQVALLRGWKQGNDETYDAWTSMSLLDKGYTLSNKVMLQYKTGRINTKTMQVLNAATNLQVSINEIADCLHHILSATLTLTKWQQTYVALALLQVVHSANNTAIVKSEVNAACSVTIDSNCQYGHFNARYDFITRQVLDFDSSQTSIDAAILHITADRTVHAYVYIDDILLSECDILDTKLAILTYDNILPGEHTVKVAWQTELGTYNYVERTIQILQGSDKLDIYDFKAVSDIDDMTPNEINAVGMFKLITGHTAQVAKTYCRQNIFIPRYYLVVYVPCADDGKTLRIVKPTSYSEHVICTNTMFNIDGFDTQIEQITDADTKETALYYKLTSQTFTSFVDYAFYSDNVLCKVQRQYQAGQINPVLFMRTLQYLGTMRNFNIAGHKLGQVQYEQLHTYLSDIEDVRLNYAVQVGNGNEQIVQFQKSQFDNKFVFELMQNNADTYLASISIDNPEALFECLGTDYAIQHTYKLRQPSLYLHKAKTLSIGMPYVVIRQATHFKLYICKSDADYLLQEDDDCMVFACATSSKYRIDATNAFYTKTITFRT